MSDPVAVRVRLPSMDHFDIIVKNEGMCCVETQNTYCFKYLAVFCIRKPNFVTVTHGQLFEYKYFIKLCNWSIHSTRVP